jgi:uncharacterized membrane protein
MISIILSVIATMICMDAVWLTINHTYHSKLIESIQHSSLQLRIIPAILVYILIACAVIFFAVLPSKSKKQSMLYGGYIGFAMYGLYDLTNLATFTNWTYEMAITDMLWGTLLCSISSYVGFHFK